MSSIESRDSRNDVDMVVHHNARGVWLILFNCEFNIFKG